MAFQDEIGISPENLGKAMRAGLAEEDGENPLFGLERGEITEDEFLERLDDGLEPLLGHRPQLHRFREMFFEALNPNQPMIELMRELKAEGLRMAMLTNNVREWEPLWRSMLPVDEIFEDGRRLRLRRLPQAGSADLRADPGADRARRREACLFIDDLQPNMRGAPRGRHDRGPLPRQRAGDRRDPRRARR